MDIKPKPTPISISPQEGRVLVKLQTARNMLPQENMILLPGQLKAGDQLLFGEIVAVSHDCDLKVGMFIYYSEYSASMVYQLGKVRRGDMTLGDAHKEENVLYVIAEDDIMAVETYEPSISV